MSAQPPMAPDSASAVVCLGRLVTACICASAVVVSLAVIALTNFACPVGFYTVEARLAQRKMQPVTHPGGRIAAVHAHPGQTVAAGDLLATIEAGDLDRRMAALKTQSDAAQLQLQVVRREAQAFSTLLEQRLVSRQRVTELERRVADLERESATVLARAAVAETEIVDTEIRAPVGGILQDARGLSPGLSIADGDVIAQIAPDETVVILEARLSPAEAKAAQEARRVRVWLGSAFWHDPRTLEGKLTWLAPATAAGRGHVAHFELVRSPRAAGDTPPLAAGQRATLTIPARNNALLQTLLDPFRRGAGRASAT